MNASSKARNRAIWALRIVIASIGQRQAVLAHFRRGAIGLRPPQDGLVAAEAAVAFAELPAHRGQLLLRRFRHAALQEQDACPMLRFAGGFRRPLVVPARAVAGLLQTQFVVEPVDDDLRLALGLHVAAHYAEAHPRRPVLAGEARNDGVERALARGVGVGLAVLE